jgi:hypothetical protein
MGIRDKPTAPASPWQNGFAQRLIGSIRHECVDHLVVLGEAHLRRILRTYAGYYNEIRTHQSLDKDAPVSRPVQLTTTYAFRFSVHTRSGTPRGLCMKSVFECPRWQRISFSLPSCCQLDRFRYFRISAASVEMSRQRLPDLLVGRIGTPYVRDANLLP